MWVCYPATLSHLPGTRLCLHETCTLPETQVGPRTTDSEGPVLGPALCRAAEERLGLPKARDGAQDGAKASCRVTHHPQISQQEDVAG